MSSNVKVAIAQINCSVGDFEGNCRKIVEVAARAAADGADLLVTPELSLTGYPPEDLLLRRAFYAASDAALQKLAGQLLQFPDLAVVVGHPLAREGHRFNAASVLQGGMVVGTYCKHDLPNYDVFDERRYFTPDNRPFVFEIKGTRFGINICEDSWFHYAPECARAAGAQVLLVPNASPFHLGKQAQRLQTMRSNVSHFGLALVYANMVGGQDELVFDGASFVLGADGAVLALAPHFEETVLVVDVVDGVPQPGPRAAERSLEALAYDALVLGVRDYVNKNGFPGALIGLSGGVDSALTLAIAVDALGADRVRAVMMPSQFTASISIEDAEQMARKLGVRHDVLPIKPAFDAYLATLASEFRGLPWDTTEENLQARIRGTLLMALSNKYGVHRADDRQQVGDRRRLFDVVRRSRRRFRGDQGHPQDAGLSPMPLSQRRCPGDPGADPDPRAERRTQGRSRPTRILCRPTMCSTKSSCATWKRRSRSATSSRPGSTMRSCAR